MGRNRTPTDQLAARGAFVSHPQRKAARRDEPDSNGPIGKAPDHLSPAAKRAFDEIVARVPYGVLWHADSILVEIAAELLVGFRKDPAGASSARIARLHSILSACAMTPVDRSKVVIRTPPHAGTAADPDSITERYFKHERPGVERFFDHTRKDN